MRHKPPLTPNQCCDMGTYDCTVPMAINRRIEGVDLCIAQLVAALNASNIPTVASCCGHGKVEPTVILESDLCLVVRKWNHETMQPEPIPNLREELEAA